MKTKTIIIKKIITETRDTLRAVIRVEDNKGDTYLISYGINDKAIIKTLKSNLIIGKSYQIKQDPVMDEPNEFFIKIDDYDYFMVGGE